jgi:hypothetical protein
LDWLISPELLVRLILPSEVRIYYVTGGFRQITNIDKYKPI